VYIIRLRGAGDNLQQTKCLYIVNKQKCEAHATAIKKRHQCFQVVEESPDFIVTTESGISTYHNIYIYIGAGLNI